MPFEELRNYIRSHYRSGKDDLISDFFSPCISNCSRYQRASGFFSSSALITWASVLPKLADCSNTLIQLIIAPRLSQQDQDALHQIADEDNRLKFLQSVGDNIVLETASFADDTNNLKLRLKLFSWMVASGRLELRFAFPMHVDAPGIFHEKIGIFTFQSGDQVAFTGSANESQMGHLRNYETIDVYRSWILEDVDRVNIKSKQFLEAWDGKATGLISIPLSRSTLEKVKTIAPNECPLDISETSGDQQVIDYKWRHQGEAIECFLAAERGILEMATGTGKTKTAMRICGELLANKNVSTIVVSADGIDLLDQWYKELLQFASTNNTPFPVLRHYDMYHERDKFILNPVKSIFLSSRLALAPALRSLSTNVAVNTLLIHDEVHRLGSKECRRSLKGLSTNIRFRLGLSATPEREYDSEGNDFVAEHIGPIIYQFDIDQAIRRRILCPFQYHPLEYIPTQDDRDRIALVYKQVSARAHAGNPMSQEEIWIELSRVYKTSRTKLPIFRDFIANKQELLKRCIVFVETMEYGQEVLEILHKHRTDFHTYYSGEDTETLRRFAGGDLECLLTCHRLSEGIDIQSLKTVILFSSARSRLESIQRMGRCLRSDPKDLNKIADIVDFIKMPIDANNDQPFDSVDQDRRAWLTSLASIRPEEEIK